MSRFVSNFENIKMDIASPELTNILIFFLFLLITVLTSKKNSTQSSNLLNYNQTEQLKGIAIFFVILGHLWVHVAKVKPSIVLSGDAVSMFLILSGFGLTISSKSKKIELKNFVLKRINRVMISYWIATIFILFLDFIILDEILDAKSMLLTFLGLNFSVKLRHLDYVRWFVTFILLWYTVFFIGHNYLERRKRLLLLLLLALTLLPLNYYIFHFGWYHFFSFPTGCIIANYYEDLNRLWNTKRKNLIICSIAGIFYVVTYKMIMSDEHVWSLVADAIPNLFLSFLNEGNSILLSMSIFLVFGYLGEKGFVSKFLLFIGRYSYELFLLHGVFLIKYNPFIKVQNGFPIEFAFAFFFTFITGLAFSLSRLSRFAYAKKI